MNRNDITFGSVGRTATYLFLGAIGTAIASIALTPIVVPLQQAAYGSFYAQIGPWRATEAAVLLSGAVVGLLAMVGPTLAVLFLRDDPAVAVPVLVAFGAAFGVSTFVMMFGALLGLLGFPVAVFLLVIVASLLSVVLYWLEVDARVTTTFVGGVPVFVLLLVLLAAGLGWGGGYDLVAEERLAANDSAIDFSEAPEVRDDLFRADNREGGDGDPVTYRLSLRGYDNESSAARFLADHGVRCPYLNANTGQDPGSFVAEHDGIHYRVTCAKYGD